MRQTSLRNILGYLRKRRRAFASLLAAFLVFSILPLLILGGLSLRFFLDYAGSQVRDAHLGRLAQVESQFSSQLDRIEQGIEILTLGTAHLQLDGITPASIVSASTIDTVRSLRDLMDTYRRASPFIQSVYYLDQGLGYIISGDDSFVPLDEFRDTDWIATLPAGAMSLEYLEPRVPVDARVPADGLVLTALMPLEGLAVTSAGFFAVNIDLLAVRAWLQSLPTSAGMDFVIADPEGRVLAGTGAWDWGAELDPALLELSRRDREAGRAGSYAVGRSLSFVTVSTRDWIFVLRMPVREYYSFARRMLGIMLPLVLVLALAALAASAYVSDRIYAPVHRLLGLIEEQSGGMPANETELSFIGDTFRRLLNEQKGLRDLVAGNAQAVRESALRRLLAGDRVDADAFVEQLARTGIHFSHLRYAVAIVLPLPSGQRPSPADSGVGQLLSVRAYESAASAGAAACGAALDMERIVLLVNADGETGVRELLEGVGEQLRSSLGIEPLAAVGEMHDGLEEAQQSYTEALVALEEWIPRADERIRFYRRSAARDAQRTHYPYAVEEALIRAVKQGERERVRRLVGEFVDELASSGSPTRGTMEVQTLSLLASVMRATGSQDHGNWLRDFLKRDVRIDAVGAWIESFLGRIIDARREPAHELEYRTLIADYIRQNYRLDISLENVADWVGLSYSYLRRIFRELFGCTFLEYLHSLRIEVVKERLREANTRIADIAASVGYPNVARLNRNFRRIVGCMPSEYRRRSRRSLLE